MDNMGQYGNFGDFGIKEQPLPTLDLINIKGNEEEIINHYKFVGFKCIFVYKNFFILYQFFV